MAEECPKCPRCLPRWLQQFADLMSLLLVFFILLLSMSTLDRRKVNEALGSLNMAMSVLEGGTMTEVSPKRIQLATPIVNEQETDEVVNRVTVTVSEFNEIVREHGGEEAVSVEDAQDGFIIRLPAALLFRPSSAVIHNTDGILFLRRIAMIINSLPQDIDISVNGHTDNSPIDPSSGFKGAWELSSARAISVAHVLIERDVLPSRITASANAQYKPIASNIDAQGRAQNRRVDIHFIGKDKNDKDNFKKSILDK
ncbi:MAG: flagellar motor protein MotB [Deltaproteobacteria bacterium]|nr:MAG: flagellar motor protein MotB [Deltaproteobacteria bacterium]